jgi:hypothetical protein
MLTYEPKPYTPRGEGVIPTGTLGLVPDLLVVTQYCADLVFDTQKTCVPTLLTPGNHDVMHESAQLLVGQLGQWQEYRQALTTKARFVANHLLSLDMFAWPWLGHNPWNIDETDDTESTESGLLNFCSPSLYQPYAPSAYYRSIQDELCNHVVSVVLNARTFLRKTLSTFRDRIRLASIVIRVLCAAVSSPLLFCSVRWEKRRWFLFHGARPPKSTAQAMWACLREACSGFILA